MAHSYILSNGLTIVLDTVPSARSICLGVWCPNGSRYEPAEFHGISHFMEHMLLKGSVHISAAGIFDTLDSIGSQVTAFTSKEYACFYTRTLDYHFDTALDVFSRMFSEPLFDPKAIATEQKVITREIEMYRNSMEDFAFDIHYGAVWKNHPLGRPILGDISSISRFDRKILTDYYHNHYGPMDSVISIAGNFDELEMLSKLEAAFGRAKNLSAGLRPLEKPNYDNAVTLLDNDCNEAHVILSFPGLHLGHPDAYALSVLSNLLGGGMNSMLFRRIRNEKGLAYKVYSNITSHIGAGLLSIYMAVQKDKVNEGIYAVTDEIKSLLLNSVDDALVNQIKEQFKASYLMGSESIVNRMLGAGKSQLLTGEILSADQVVDKIDGITASRVQQLMGEIFDFNKMSITAIGHEAGTQLTEVVENAV